MHWLTRQRPQGVLPHLLAAHGITDASQLSAFFDR